MRHLKSIIAVVSAVVLGAVFVQGLPVAGAADEKAVPEAERVYPLTYKVSDLPVYSQDGEHFDPSILIAYIKAAVDTKAWDEGSGIAAYPANRALVIGTTSDNHKAIRKAMEFLRSDRNSQTD